MAKLWGLSPDEADLLEGISLGRPQDIAKYTGKPVLENNADDITEYFVYKGVNDEFDQLVPKNLQSRTRSYLPAKSLGSSLNEVANAIDDYKFNNRSIIAPVADSYDSTNFDYQALVRKGKEEIAKELGKDGLATLEENIGGTLKNLNRNYDRDVVKTAQFLNSPESDKVVEISKQLLPPGTRVYRGGKDGINWTTSLSVAQNYSDDPMSYVLKKTDRYIAPQFTTVFHDGVDSEYTVLLLRK